MDVGADAGEVGRTGLDAGPEAEAGERGQPAGAPVPAGPGPALDTVGHDGAQGRGRRRRGLAPLGGGRLLRFTSRARTVAPANPRPDAEDALFLAIGRVAANWSLVELVSGLVLMGLVGSREETLARAVVAGQRVENVWDTIEALLVAYGERVEDQLAEFRRWRRQANSLRRRRNEAIHSAWSLTESTGKPAAWDMMSQKAKQGARADLFPGGVAELEDLARDIAALEARLTALHASIFLVPDAGS